MEHKKIAVRIPQDQDQGRFEENIPSSSTPLKLTDIENGKRKRPSKEVNEYSKLLRLECRKTYVTNQDKEFECPICFTNILRYKGVILRNCLHKFCNDCLIGSIKFSEEAEVKCPYMDENYSCICILQVF